MRVDGENLGPGTHQQNILVADVTEQRLTAEFTRCDALREIWPGGRGLRFSHVHSLHGTGERSAAFEAVEAL